VISFFLTKNTTILSEFVHSAGSKKYKWFNSYEESKLHTCYYTTCVCRN